MDFVVLAGDEDVFGSRPERDFGLPWSSLSPDGGVAFVRADDRVGVPAEGVRAVLWHPGPADRGRSEGRDFAALLRTAVVRFRDDPGLPPSVPFIAGTPIGTGLADGTRDAGNPEFGEAAEAVVATTENVGLVSSAGLLPVGGSRGFGETSLRELGERFFRMWRSMSAVPPERIAAQAAKYRDAPRARTGILLDPGEFLVTSPFGRRTHPVTGEAESFHAGLDGALWNGRMLLETGICAWRDGVVLAAADGTGPAGTFAAIDHGGGWVSRSFHLEAGSLRVSAGERVKAGRLLGWMGKTGRATGEHLHFQLEKDGVPVDPFPILLSGAAAT